MRVCHRQIDGFDDATDLLGPGVYVLERDGKVIFVAWAKNVLERVAAHRRLLSQTPPSWFPVKAIIFDRFHFHRCASDVAERLVTDLITRYNPPLNRTPSNAASTPPRELQAQRSAPA